MASTARIEFEALGMKENVQKRGWKVMLHSGSVHYSLQFQQAGHRYAKVYLALPNGLEDGPYYAEESYIFFHSLLSQTYLYLNHLMHQYS